jgi:hypothetical protein
MEIISKTVETVEFAKFLWFERDFNAAATGVQFFKPRPYACLTLMDAKNPCFS